MDSSGINLKFHNTLLASVPVDWYMGLQTAVSFISEVAFIANDKNTPGVYCM